jgi:hypothetical protein
MGKELEEILKEAGAIKLKVAQNFVTPFKTCTVSDVYSKSFPAKAAVIENSFLYILFDLKLDKNCKYDEVVINKNVPLNEGDIVYVVPEDQIVLLQQHIHALKKYF